MKLRISFIVCLILISKNLCTQQKPQDIHIHINTANTANLEQQNHTNLQADHVSSPSNQTNTHVKIGEAQEAFYQKWSDFYNKYAKTCQEKTTDIMTWVQSNKLKSAGVSLLIFYSYISYQIYQANTIIESPHAWANWQYSKSLEELFTTPQSKLESDLLFAIQTRYVHPTNPTDFIYPLIQSSISLNEEMQILHEQTSRYEWIESCGCLPLFFIDEQDVEKLKDKKRKLAYIKHLFASWCAAYKIDKNS